MIRLYGHMSGSFKTVTQGMRIALEKNGKLAGCVPGESLEAENSFPGAEADIAITVGAPNRAYKSHIVGNHEKHWLLLAPNSFGVPPELVKHLSGETYDVREGGMRPLLDGLLAPSLFAKKVLERAFPEIPVVVWQHGILPEFSVREPQREVARKNREAGGFRLLHVTSTRMDRKGTKELLVAWKVFVERHPKSYLDILVNPMHFGEISDHVKHERARHVSVTPGQNYSQTRYIEGLSLYNGIVQPSRAEGFGLVPLEALACGVPVVVTQTTGHEEYTDEPGVVTLEAGDPAESDDFSGATAPTVSPGEILRGLEDLHENWEILDQEAMKNSDSLRKRWSWEARAIEPLEQVCQTEKRIFTKKFSASR